MRITRVALIETFVVFSLILLSAPLRFYQLGFSDYIPDEPGAFLLNNDPAKTGMFATDFLLSQRKGPMQFLISHIPYLITKNFNNEFAQRLPFAVFNTLAVVMFYLFVRNITNNRLVGIVAAVLFSLNGFAVAFGRTAQYQSLNMFFSFTALYFYAQLITSKQSLIAKTLAGTAALSLSTLSHWDAVFILPPIIIFFAKFLLDKTFQKEYKAKLLGFNFLLGCALLLPFLVPYIQTLRADTANQEYLWGRVGLRPDTDQNGNVFTFNLYNPFLTIWLYTLLGFVGLLAYKKSYIFAVWAAFVLAIFTFFVHHSGTHIYNLAIPVIILAAIGFGETLRYIPNYFGVVVALGMGGFLYYQSYLIFVDRKVEYPWERERILSWKTPGHSALDNMRNKIGFSHKRYWKEINGYVNRQNQENGEDFGFITNEDKSLSSYYMDVERTQNLDGFYYIGIKRPYSFQTDWKMPQVKNKEEVHQIDNEYGESVVKIYRVSR